MSFNFKSILPHIVALVVFIITCFVYFSPQFSGKVIQQGDIVAYRGMSEEIHAFKRKTGTHTHWTNSMFGGMPTYQIHFEQNNNLVIKTKKFLSLYLSGPAGTVISGMICCYICLILLGISPWISIIGCLVFGLSTVNLIYLGAGHNTKIATIFLSPPIVAGMILTMRKKYILGGSIFTFFLSLALSSNHVQMILYLAIACLLFMAMMLITAIKKNRIMDYAKSSCVLLIGALLALGTFSTVLLPTKEYSEDTMRGKQILSSTSSNQEVTSSSHKDGLEWDYSMYYSNNLLDVIGGFIPRAAGGGSNEVISKNSKFAKTIKSRKDTPAPLYFGGLPPTAGVFYLGAVMFFLFIFGGFIIKGNIKWWLISAVTLTFLMSMGKYASFINKPLFDLLPMLNKFRAPNSIISVTSIFIPILGTLGLQKVFASDDRKKFLKPLLISFACFGGFILLYGLLAPFFLSFEGPSDAQYAKYPGLVDALKTDRASYLRSSSFRSLFFIGMTVLTIYGCIKEWFSKYAMVVVIALLALIDIVGVSTRYLSSKNFVTKKKYKSEFVARPVDKQILNDKDPHYRVHDITVNPWNTSAPAYYHKMIGGYHAAKLQRIQDVIDRYLSRGDQAIFNMLNTKYFIVNGPDKQPIAQRNPAAIGNAWYVAQVKNVANANEEIDALDGFDPRLTAVVHNEFKNYMNGNISTDGSIKLTSYAPNKLEYQAIGNGEHLAVFSEIWYGPNKGWQAYIDGEKVDHIRVNYLLRGLKIPSGNHTIVFEFNPSSYRIGETLSLISSILIFAFLGFTAFTYFRKNNTATTNG